MKRVLELDGLRGAAIGMVILYHYFQIPLQASPASLLDYLQRSVALSWTGVDLFFVLSGFLIGGILLDSRNSSNYFRVFYTRRFFRIIPLYVVALVVFPAIVSIARWTNHGNFFYLAAGNSLPWWSYWTFTQNFWMAGTERLGVMTLAVTWSLAIEEQFYMTLPFLVRFLTGPQLSKCVRYGIYAAPLLRIGLGFKFHHNWIAEWGLMPCRMDALLLGVMAAMLLRDVQWKEKLLRNRDRLLALILFLFVGMIVFTVFAPTVDNTIMQSLGYSWTALFYTSVLLYAVTQPSSVLSRALRFSWLGKLGGLAYGIYLLHEVVLGMVFGVMGMEPSINNLSTLLATLLALLLTILLAHFSWRYFESPVINWRRGSYV